MARRKLTDMERLALMQSVYKVVADQVSTRNPGSLRHRMDEQARRDYAESGVKSRDLLVNGKKVGTYSVTMTKEVPPEHHVGIRWGDGKAPVEEFSEWCDENLTKADLLDFVTDGGEDTDMMESLANWWFGATGEVPAGFERYERDVPGMEPTFKGTTIRVSPEKVARAMGAELPGAVVGLLGGE